jgi:hypothetical protein
MGLPDIFFSIKGLVNVELLSHDQPDKLIVVTGQGSCRTIIDYPISRDLTGIDALVVVREMPLQTIRTLA